ncbi:hypothetical protein HYX08_03975 [Candidatus Woesearchaeota archaeon]|nr:hypothetical protein [Candidatus Woesearchaeota archaeon]
MVRINNIQIFNSKKAFEINLRTLFYILAALFTVGVMGFIILRAMNIIFK